MTSITFFVPGLPKPQGSKKAFIRPGAKFPTMIESAGKPLKDWRETVEAFAKRVGLSLPGQVKVYLDFRLPRPKSHFHTGKRAGQLRPEAPEWHAQKPDIDKLSRAVLDALTNVVIEDDSRVVKLIAGKRFDSEPGCWIRIEEAKDGAR